MATRAAFWVGDPRELEAREWLGCLAYAGYPDGAPGRLLRGVTTAEEFRLQVGILAIEQQEFFALPAGGWPYPWDDDIFLTDYTYAWMDGQVMATCFHQGFYPLEAFYREDRPDEQEGTDTLPRNIAAPSRYNAAQPDSIIIICRPKGKEGQ